MKAERLFRALMCEPWYIMPEAIQATLNAIPIAAHYLNEGILGRAPAEAIDYAKMITPIRDQVEHNGEVAVLPVKGVLGIGWSDWEKHCGGIDSLEIAAALRELVGDPAVSVIVMDVDSPGGLVNGTPELAEEIATLSGQKPIFAFTRSLMASSAYFISAGCNAVYASKSATVGSIGVYLALLDLSGLYDKLGLRADVIKTGDFKAAGYPGTSLTDEQRANFQESVDFAYADFSKHVQTYRPNVTDETMQGQCFWAEQAVSVGLVDSVATFEQTVEDARRFGASS